MRSFIERRTPEKRGADLNVVAVTEEIFALSGVIGVDIELVMNGNSRVTVASEHPLDANLVRASVDEAGYEISD